MFLINVISSLVRHLLRYTRHPFVHYGYWAISGSTVQAVAGFVANFMLVRLLLPTDFGRFAIVHSNIAIVGSVFSLHLSALLIRETEHELQRGNRDLYLSAFAGETLLVGVASFAVLRLWGLWDLLSCALLFGTLVGSWVRIQRILYERGFDYSRLSTLEAGAYVASYLFTVAGVMWGVGAAALYLRCWIEAVIQLVWLYRIRGIQRFRLRWLRLQDWQLVIHRVRGLWANGVLHQSFERIIILVIGAFSSAQDTGYFFQAYKLATVPNRLLMPLARRVLTNYLRHRVLPGRKLRFLQKVIISEAAALTVAAAFVITFSNGLVVFALGPGWHPVVRILQFMAPAIVCMTVLSSLQAYCIAEQRVGAFVLLGRGTQYAALGIGVVSILSLAVPAQLAIAIAVSVGYIAATVLVLIWVLLRPRP